MSEDIKKPYVPHLFDKVHNDIYGYGTVIGVENPDEFDPTGYNAIVLFDRADDALHAGGDYRECCDLWIDVPHNVRMNRCYWCEVQELSTYLEYSARGELRDDEVCLVPFDSLEYKEHPIRVVGTLPHIPVFNGSIVHRNLKEDFLILCDDGGYCWAKADNLSLIKEFLGTVSDVWTNEEVEDDDVGEDLTNPSYYNVEGASQPIEDMEALMTPEQFEGFLWGNIIKYSKRFGRKGDKILTLGKIIWYADRLKTHLEKESDVNGHD